MDTAFPLDEATLESLGYERQSTRTQGGWLVHYSHPVTWSTTGTMFVPDSDDMDDEE